MENMEKEIKSTIDKVKEFHRVFKRAINVFPVFGQKEVDLRIKLLDEELNELKFALYTCNRIKTLDALTDLQYILDGTYIALGYARIKEQAFDEVHKSNMAKLDKNNEPIIREDGKILKPEGWQEPNLRQFCYKECGCLIGEEACDICHTPEDNEKELTPEEIN